MNDSAGVRMIESGGDIARDRHNIGERQSLPTLESRLECVAPNEGCGEIDQSADSPVVEQRQDVGMLELLDDPDLALETALPDYGRHFRTQDFYGDELTTFGIAGQQDISGTAFAELAGVALRQRRGEALDSRRLSRPLFATQIQVPTHVSCDPRHRALWPRITPSALSPAA